MGMGMGELQPNQKYVVLVEVYGPTSKNVGDMFDQMLLMLHEQFGSKVKWTAHADKASNDPLGKFASKSKRASKGKRGGKRGKPR
jgi:hypothetical protein